MLSPLDRHNQTLLSHVHPLDWVNPTPTDRYDLVVIGAGTAGLVIAAGAAGLGIGLKIALVERNLMGGDCLNVGCIPSKCVIRSSRVVADLQTSADFGIFFPSAIEVDFAAVMERMRQIRASISPHDSAQRFQQLGVDVFFGQAQFVDARSLTVHSDTGTTHLRFKKAAIATGARASQPAIPGLAEAGYLTNETVFNLTERPQRLAVIGGGPIGCELGQAFRRLGCQVTLFHKHPHLLDRAAPEAAAILQQQFQRDQIHLILNTTPSQIHSTPSGKQIHYQHNGTTHVLEVDAILVATGRTPNVDGLNLEAAGVVYHPQQGVLVNDYLQTSNPCIYAAGDICMDWKFTHAADAAARLVIKNALFAPFGLGRGKLSQLLIPSVTYTDPEVAQVGLSAAATTAQGLPFNTIHIPFSKVDRALTDGESEGFLNLIHDRRSDRILGATIVARHAGEMISELTLAIATRQGLSAIANVIHPYPTQAEAIKKAADAYRRTRLTPRTQTLLRLLSKLS